MATISKFNSGKFTSTDIDEQYNDQFWSKGAVREAMRKRTFSQLGDRLTQPKHWGDVIVKERHLPILHPMNQLDGGVDGATASLLTAVFYAYDASGALLDTYETRDYATATDAETAAKDAAGAEGSVRNGAGSLYNGDADYAVVKGSFPTLTEIGGNVNAVNAKSVTLRGNVAEYGMHMKFTQRSIDMDSRTGVLAQKTKDLGEAKGDIFESQIQADLLAASELNRVFAGSAATVKACNRNAELTFADLRMMEQELKRLLVPRDTKIIKGSTKIGTVTVQKAFYVYVGQELYPTLQDMTNAAGVSVWEPLESYADAAGSNYAEGEIGRIGGFRFIEVANMLKYAGKGATAGDAGTADDVDGFQASTIPYGDTDAGSLGFDVFPVLFVGSDSFATVGFEGDSSRIKTAMPKADAHLDPFGKNGSMSISWFFGTLIYKAERIRQLACVAKLV